MVTDQDADLHQQAKMPTSKMVKKRFFTILGLLVDWKRWRANWLVTVRTISPES